jgi:hypothetical protein
MLYAFTKTSSCPCPTTKVTTANGLLSKMPGDMWRMFCNLRLSTLHVGTTGKKLLSWAAVTAVKE